MMAPARTDTTRFRFRVWFAEDPGHASLARVIACLVSTRAVLALIGYFAVRLNHPWLHSRARHDFRHATAIVGWLRYDAWWFVSVVEDGYSFEPRAESNVAFLPGFPALIALFTPLFGSAAVAGLVVANLSFVAAVVVLFGWVRDRAGVAAAERAALFLVLYPLSFFFDTAYAEAPFFLSAVLALREADRGRFRAAGLHAAFATLTRPMGLFLVPAFAWTLAQDVRAGRSSRRVAFSVLAPLIALGAYALYLWSTLGTPLATLTAQRVGWGVGKYFNQFQLPERTDAYRKILDVYHLVVPVPLVLLSLRAWRKLGPAPGIFALLTAAVVIVFGWDSLGREVLAVVPVFAVAGLTPLPRATIFGARGLELALLLIFAYAFVMGHFMG
jgi:Gpi18-like mannosyltransferase